MKRLHVPRRSPVIPVFDDRQIPLQPAQASSIRADWPGPTVKASPPCSGRTSAGPSACGRPARCDRPVPAKSPRASNSFSSTTSLIEAIRRRRRRPAESVRGRNVCTASHMLGRPARSGTPPSGTWATVVVNDRSTVSCLAGHCFRLRLREWPMSALRPHASRARWPRSAAHASQTLAGMCVDTRSCRRRQQRQTPRQRQTLRPVRRLAASTLSNQKPNDTAPSTCIRFMRGIIPDDGSVAAKQVCHHASCRMAIHAPADANVRWRTRIRLTLHVLRRVRRQKEYAGAERRRIGCELPAASGSMQSPSLPGPRPGATSAPSPCSPTAGRYRRGRNDRTPRSGDRWAGAGPGRE